MQETATNSKLAEGVALVRDGMGLEDAARQIGFTMSALRTACFQAGHRFYAYKPRIKEIATRRDRVIALFQAKTPLNDIVTDTGMTVVGIKKLLKRELGLDLAVKGRCKRKSELRVARARRIARLYLENRHTKHHVSLAVLASRNGLSRSALEHAVKMLRKAALDPYSNVSDTAFERRPE